MPLASLSGCAEGGRCVAALPWNVCRWFGRSNRVSKLRRTATRKRNVFARAKNGCVQREVDSPQNSLGGRWLRLAPPTTCQPEPSSPKRVLRRINLSLHTAVLRARKDIAFSRRRSSQFRDAIRASKPTANVPGKRSNTPPPLRASTQGRKRHQSRVESPPFVDCLVFYQNMETGS